MRKILFILSLVLLWTVIVSSFGWASLALLYAGDEPSSPLRLVFLLSFIIVFLIMLIMLIKNKNKWKYIAIYVLLWFGIIGWYFNIQPSNERNWQSDVAILPYAKIEDNIVTVYNIRNFEYKSETDYIPHYYTRTFNIEELVGVDLIASYWMGPSIAHTFLSFSFKNEEPLAISIETRKEQSESYSTVKGFFKVYELFYVVADEHDVIDLRTTYRQNPPENVYRYKLKGSKKNTQMLFLEYIHQINKLKNKPQFYNSLSTNCTTGIWVNTHINSSHLAFNWKILLSGYLPEYLYEKNRIESYGLSFKKLQEISHINVNGNNRLNK